MKTDDLEAAIDDLQAAEAFVLEAGEIYRAAYKKANSLLSHREQAEAIDQFMDGDEARATSSLIRALTKAIGNE